jgi:ketosteroid isomerase-like protein
MGVASPELMDQVFAERFNAPDKAALLELYRDDAVFTFDGEAKAVGLEQIGRTLSGFLAAPLKFSGKFISVYVSGDTALTRMMGAAQRGRRHNLIRRVGRGVEEAPGWEVAFPDRRCDRREPRLVSPAMRARGAC